MIHSMRDKATTKKQTLARSYVRSDLTLAYRQLLAEPGSTNVYYPTTAVFTEAAIQRLDEDCRFRRGFGHRGRTPFRRV